MAEKNNNPYDENSRNIKEKGNLVTCAACKHLRRKCQLENCILWRFFPASETQQFLAAQKIFGISNITKKFQELDTLEKRDEAARALKHVAMLWEKDPVHGASGEISRSIQEIGKLQQLLHQPQEGPMPIRQVPAFDGVGITQQIHDMGNRSACAICKNMRRKCSPEKCVLWRFFPASENETFLAVHKAFGISNITKIIQEVDSMEEKAAAAAALKHEAILWRGDPVLGPSGEISRLEQAKERLKKEIQQRQLLDQCGSSNIMEGVADHGVLEIGWSSGTEKSIHDQGGHSGTNTINQSTSANVGGEYGSGRVFGMDAGNSGINVVSGEGGDVPIGGTPRTEHSFLPQGGYNGNSTDANVSGYDSGIIVGMEAAGRTERKAGSSGNVAQTGSSSGSEQ